jgi:hypothetical protein
MLQGLHRRDQTVAASAGKGILIQIRRQKSSLLVVKSVRDREVTFQLRSLLFLLIYQV